MPLIPACPARSQIPSTSMSARSVRPAPGERGRRGGFAQEANVFKVRFEGWKTDGNRRGQTDQVKGLFSAWRWGKHSGGITAGYKMGVINTCSNSSPGESGPSRAPRRRQESEGGFFSVEMN